MLSKEPENCLLMLRTDSCELRASDMSLPPPGALHLPHYLTPAQQQDIAGLCLALGHQPAGFYTPTVRGGGTMQVRMMCLGRHWNARTYTYESVARRYRRPAGAGAADDLAGSPPRAADAGFAIHARPLHRQLVRAERPDGPAPGQGRERGVDRRGAPVVSFSIGDTARFLFGG